MLNSYSDIFVVFFAGTGSEEVSVFNGDENHKVWAGKSPEPAIDGTDGIYDEGHYGSTLRSFRSTVSGTSHRNRPRQMLMPSSPPPPPIPEEKEDGAGGPHNIHNNKKDKKKKKRSKSRDALDSSAPPGMQMYMGNGSILNGAPPSRKHSSSGSLLGVPRAMMNGHAQGHGHPRGSNGVPPGMKSGTFTGRGKKNKGGGGGQNGGQPPPGAPYMMYGMPPPHLMPPPGHPLYGMPPYAQPMYAGPPPPFGGPGGGGGGGGGRPGSRAMEEPIYMPHNARPLSPVASYQPGHFPHEAYYNQQQYATIDKANKHRGKSKKNNNNNAHHGGDGHHAPYDPNKIGSSDSNAEESEFGAGIYKKGHINERAFSYSIRNEHRSRSYGSLSNMQFGPNGEPLPPTEGIPGGSGDEMGPGGPNGNGNKQDFLHMMSELELGDDTIERREVPPGLYPPRGGGLTAPPGPPNMPPMMMVPPEVGGGGGGGRKKR